MMDAQKKVDQWIEQNFVLSAIKVIPYHLFPFGQRIIDCHGDEMLVYFDFLTDKVKYVFPSEKI
jgi:hypothetical protein